MSRRHPRYVLFAVLFAWLGACSAPARPTLTPQSPPTQVPPTATFVSLEALTPQIEVSDQSAMKGTVTIASVSALEQGWLAINADRDGAPGIVIGYSPVKAGINAKVVVFIDLLHATPQLWVVLHVDRGEVGTWEFPGPDVPVQFGGNTVMAPFSVTLPSTRTP